MERPIVMLLTVALIQLITELLLDLFHLKNDRRIRSVLFSGPYDSFPSFLTFHLQEIKKKQDQLDKLQVRKKNYQKKYNEKNKLRMK